MEELLIKSTKKTPYIHLREGDLRFEGKSISEDPKTFYVSSLLWVNEYAKNLPSSTDVNIRLEYSDTKSIKMIYEILQILTTAGESQNKQVNINWYYENGDGEMIEQGEVLQSELGVEFNFIPLKD